MLSTALRNKKPNTILSAVFLAVFFAAFVPAGLAADDWIYFNGTKKVKRVSSDGSDRIVIEGDATFKNNRFEITADTLIIYGKKQQYVEGLGSVKIKDKEKHMNLMGEKLFFDRDKDVLNLKGNCLLEDFDNEMVLRGGILEHRNKENITTIQVGVRIMKKDLTARAELMVYRRDTDTAELSGMPVVYSKDDEFRARQIVINLKTDEYTMIGRVSGQLKGESKN